MNSNGVSANKENISSQASAWWIRVDSNNMDADENAKFNDWLNANPLHREAFNEVSRIWHNLEDIKERLAAAMPAPVKKTQRLSQWQWGIIALASCYLLFILINPLNLWLRADETTGIAEMRTVRLNDGSMVQLNSETALAINMTNTTRQLTLLKGEAQFTVKPDPFRPFQVRAGNGVITALGTAFNVHHNQTITEVTVTEHRVSVQLESESAIHPAPVIVGNGQQVSYNQEMGLSAIKPVETRLTTAWQRGKLVFQDKTLAEVIAELNHYHRGYFVIADPTIATLRVNGVFSTDKPIAALNIIEKSLQLHSNRLSHFLVLLHR